MRKKNVSLILCMSLLLIIASAAYVMADCTVTINPTSNKLPQSGGSGSFNVTADNSCAWTATTVETWVTITGKSGTGNGTVSYSAGANTATTARSAMINLTGASFTLTQEATSSTPPPSPTPPPTMTPPPTPTPGPTPTPPPTMTPLPTPTPGPTPTPPPTMTPPPTPTPGPTPTPPPTMTPPPSPTPPPAPNCALTINPTNMQFTSIGGVGSFNVMTSTSTCAWTATTADSSWLTITSGTPGTGNGTVKFTVTPNIGTSTRSGVINLPGLAFTIKQDAPGTSNCTITLNPTNMIFPPPGGSGSFSVMASTNTCTWNATTADSSWVTITSGFSGTGNGIVNFTVMPNTGTTARSGVINLPGAFFTIKQDPPATSNCTVGLNPTQKNFPPSGGSDSFNVMIQIGCTWNATTADSSWITITSGGSGSGNGTVNYSVTQNTGTYPRTGTIDVYGKPFTIIQAPATPNCMITINPMNVNYPPDGGSGSVNVSGPSGCAWTASTADSSWVTITSGNSGTGNGAVNYTVAKNTGTSPRTGIINIAGVPFQIVQNPSGSTCGAITLTPMSRNFAPPGGSDNITVTAGSGCSWNASTSANWIIITSGSSGAGSGSVGYNVMQNISTTPRTGTITVGGQTFTVNQDASSTCGFSINPMSKQFQAYGGSDSVNITGANDCKWSVASNTSWITISSPTSGTGNASISYSVAQNSGASRTGTINIGGQTFMVSQLGTDCATGMSINPMGKIFPSAGGSDSVMVATPNTGCPWTATSNDTWISITAGSSGTGNGAVSYTVAANTTNGKRTATMTIAGQTFTVSQDVAQAGQVTLTVTLGASSGTTAELSKMMADSAQGSGSGIVTLSSGVLSWSQDGKIGTASFAKDVVVVLSADEGLGSTVKGWTGCDLNIGTNQCMVKMTTDKKITVDFSLQRTAQYDFDGDGNSDVIWRDSKTGDVYIWLMDGKTIKGGDYVVRNAGLDWDVKAVGDFNGDGRADLLWQNKATGDVYIYIMQGTQISTGGFAVKGLSSDWEIKAIGDFDGDGKTDIMWRNSNNGDIYVWLMDGTNVIGGGYMLRGMSSDWDIKVVADLNGDGKSDIIWQSSVNGDVYAWLLNGLTISGQGFLAKGIPKNWVIETISDFDGDGKADILWHETSANDYAIWFMDGTKIIGGDYVTRAIPANWKVMKAGDYNGDGKADLLWRDTNTGDVYIFLLNNATTKMDEGFVAKGIPDQWQTR
ncbi:MAG: VCBS repeat-containing protein [Nitrospirae bacterium]|nr:VCBS repeat-containing protein [Nitrospirota bacterium]